MSFKIILLSATLLCSCAPAWAMTAPQPLSQLVSRSDAVVVVTFDGVSQSGDDYYIGATAIRVPAGFESALQPGPLQILTKSEGASQVSFAPDRTVSRLCFLTSRQGDWEIVSRVQNGYSLDELCFSALSDTEVKALSQSLRVRLPDSFLAEAAFGMAARGTVGPFDVAQIVSGIDPAEIDEMVTSLQASLLPYADGLTVALQLKHSDPAAPEKMLGSYWRALPGSFREQVAGLLCSDYRSPSALAMPALGKLTQGAAPAFVRRCAAMALRAIHVDAALPYLADLLTSDDADLRLLGVLGLSDTVHTGRIPFEPPLMERGAKLERTNSARITDATMANRVSSRDSFLENEQRYLPFWPNWWQSNRESITQENATDRDIR